MELKRGISIGIIFYLVSFTVGGILGLIFNFNIRENPNPIFLSFAVVSMILLTVIVTYWYFKKEDISKGYKEGFKFGLVMFIVGGIIDLIVLMIYAGLKQDYSAIVQYYTSYLFFIILVSLILTSTIAGGLIKKFSKK